MLMTVLVIIYAIVAISCLVSSAVIARSLILGLVDDHNQVIGLWILSIANLFAGFFMGAGLIMFGVL